MAETTPVDSRTTEAESEDIRTGFDSGVATPSAPPETSQPTPEQNQPAVERLDRLGLRQRLEDLRVRAEYLRDRAKQIPDANKYLANFEKRITQLNGLSARLLNDTDRPTFDKIQAFAQANEIEIKDTETKIIELDQKNAEAEPVPETSPSTPEQEPTLFPETEPAPPPPPPPAMIQIEGLQALGALAADIGPSNSRALDERIQRHLDRFDAQLGSTDSNAFKEVWGRLVETRDGIVMTVARKLDSESEQSSEQNQELDLTAAKMRLNEKLASLLDASEAEKRQFDELVRGAVIEQVIASRTVDIEKRLQKELDRVSREIERNNPGRGKESKLRGFFEIAGATAVGMAVRNLVVNAGLDVAGRWAVDAGVGTATRTLSGASGAIAGGVVGGALGALKAEREAMRQTYAYSNIDSRIKTEQARLTEQARTLGRETPVINEAEALIQLIERGDLRADTVAEIGVIREKINEYHRLQAQEELEAALRVAKESPSSENESAETNLARAYIALLDAHREGSEKNRTNAWDRCWQVLGAKQSATATEAFTTGLKRDVLKQTGWGALKGALWGAGIGGVIGAVWPPASMFAKVGAEAATHNPLFQEAARALAEGDNGRAVDILVKNFKLDMFQGSKLQFEGHNLYYWAHELVSKAGTGENGLRALHQLLSYPAETIQAAGGIDQLIELVKNGSISGPDLTNSLLHGGAGVDQQALATNLNNYLQREGIAHWLWRGGPEVLPGTPLANNNWQNMAGFILSSMGARYAATHQVTHEAGKVWANRPDWVKGLFGTKDNASAEANNDPTEGKGESPELNDKPQQMPTEVMAVDGELLGQFEAYTSKAEITDKQKEFKRRMENLHGRFFILPPKESGGEPRVCRVWTKETDHADAYYALAPGSIHRSEMQQDNPERTGYGTKGEPSDPGYLDQGKVWVVEYPDIAPFYAAQTGAGPKFDKEISYAEWAKTHEKNSWKTASLLHDGRGENKAWHTMDAREIFQGDPNQYGQINQTFINPSEIEMYVYAVKKGYIAPGMSIPVAIGSEDRPLAVYQWIDRQDRRVIDKSQTQAEKAQQEETAQQGQNGAGVEQNTGGPVVPGEPGAPTATTEPPAETSSISGQETEASVETETAKPSPESSIRELDQAERASLLEKVILPTTEFKGLVLTKERLAIFGLGPRYEITIDNRRIWTSSKKFYFRERLAGLAYLEDGDQIRPLPYISSGSQGIFRFYPGFNFDHGEEHGPWFHKGHDEQSLALPIALQELLSRSSIEIVPTGIINPLQAEQVVYGCYDKKLAEPPRILLRFPGQEQMLGVDQTPQIIEGISSARLENFDQGPESIDPTDPQDKPDYNKSVARWQTEIPVYDQVAYEALDSINGKYRYLFGSDIKAGITRAWIAAIELVESPINDHGLKQQWVNASVLLTPAFEYPGQLVDKNGKDYGDRHIANEGYLDAFINFTSHIPMIRDYLRHKSTS